MGVHRRLRPYKTDDVGKIEMTELLFNYSFLVIIFLYGTSNDFLFSGLHSHFLQYMIQNT